MKTVRLYIGRNVSAENNNGEEYELTTETIMTAVADLPNTNAYTCYEALGVWCGEAERSLVFEFCNLNEDQAAQLTNRETIGHMASALRQYEVMTMVLDGEVERVKAIPTAAEAAK